MLPSEQGTDSVTQPPEKEEKKEKEWLEMPSDIFFIWTFVLELLNKSISYWLIFNEPLTSLSTHISQKWPREREGAFWNVKFK